MHQTRVRSYPNVEDDIRVDRGGLVLQSDFLKFRFDRPTGAVPESLACGIADSNHENTEYDMLS